jgi:hypothetical protein
MKSGKLSTLALSSLNKKHPVQSLALGGVFFIVCRIS